MTDPEPTSPDTASAQGATATAPPLASPGSDEPELMFFLSLASIALGVIGVATSLLMYFAQSTVEGAAPTGVFAWYVWIGAGGAFFLVLGLGLNAEKIWSYAGQRRSAIALNVIVMTFLAFALAVLANWVSSRHFREWDWTRQRIYQISDESIQIVKHLEKPIRIFVIQSSAEQSDQVRRLIDHYRSHSTKITVEYIDPATDPLIRQKLIPLGLDLQTLDEIMSIVVQSGSLDENGKWKAEKSKHIANRELFESASFDPMEQRGRPQMAFRGESVLTNAILEVSEGTKSKLYFTTGHKEAQLEGRNPKSDGEIGELTRMLRAKNYDVAPLNFVDRPQRDVPEDATVVVIAGYPDMKAFPTEEVAALETYLKNGGKLLALIPPTKQPNAAKNSLEWYDTGLDGLLRKYNVELGKLELVVLARVGPFLQRDASNIVDGWDSTSRITEPFYKSGSRAVFFDSRPVKALTENPKVTATEIARTNKAFKGVPDALTWINAEEGDPFPDAEHKAWPVMVQVEQKLDAPGSSTDKKAKATRIVVAGDSRWVSNALVTNPSYDNEALVQNCLSFLCGQERFSKEPVRGASYRLDMSKEALVAYQLLAILGLPGFAVLAAIVVLIVRR